MLFWSKISVWWSDAKRDWKVIFIQDKVLIILLVLSFVLNLLLYLAIYWFIKPTVDPITLHYSVYFGIDLIDNWYKIYLMPVVGSFLFLVNGSLAWFFYRNQKLVSYFLIGAIFLIEVLLDVAGTFLILINR